MQIKYTRTEMGATGSKEVTGTADVSSIGLGHDDSTEMKAAHLKAVVDSFFDTPPSDDNHPNDTNGH